MAKERVLKEGLEFFPLDIDYFDDSKILLIEAKFGLPGSIVATRLLCAIYRQGYYMIWNDGEALALARRVGNGVTFELINEIVKGLLNCDFFDQRMFESFGILTSKGIQTRWSKIILDCNRKSRIKSDFSLLIDDKKSDLTPKKSEERTQSKVKESKVEENKVEESITADVKIETDEFVYDLPDQATPEAYKLVTKIAEYFSVKNGGMNPVYNSIQIFIETIFHRGQIEILSTSLESYKAYKARSQEQIHGVIKWIGTKENHYQDGFWITTDWENKNKNYNGTSKTTQRASGSTGANQVTGTDYSGDRRDQTARVNF